MNISTIKKQHHTVVIIGGGQAGLSISYYLSQKNIDHLVIEKSTLLNAWKEKRWDSFTLVTPNWQCQLPDYPYTGDDPNGFMNREQIIDYLEGFIEKVDAPVLENTEVNHCQRLSDMHYQINSSRGELTANHVVIATGGYHHPIIPRLTSGLPESIQQIHSEQYKSAELLADGAVLVVGSGQSGTQIAEDLHIEGREVYLATGSSPRCARFYRGRDVVDWLADMNYYDMPVESHPLKEGVRDNSNHYVTGRDGGRDIDLRQFALEGMHLFGQLKDFDGESLFFDGTLKENLDSSDATYNRINQKIDQFIKDNKIEAPAGEHYTAVWQPEKERLTLPLKSSGINTIIWCIGFKHNFNWIKSDIFDEKGYPQHQRGITAETGMYFLGLPWLHTWGSGRFSGIARDAKFIAEHIEAIVEKKANDIAI